MTTTHQIRREVSRLMALVVATPVLLVLMALPVLAHVELSSSSPADGATIVGPLDEITLTFSADADPAGDGLMLFDATGALVDSSIRVASGTEIAVVPAASLQAGRYAITWTMKAGDAHPKSGGVEFTVAAAASAVPTAPTEPQGASPPTPIPTVSADTPSILDAVTSPRASTGADWLGRIARTASITAVLLGIGAFAFGLLVFEGTRAEAKIIGFWARRAGAVIVLAALVETLAQSMLLSGSSFIGALHPGSIVEALGGSFGMAILLRIVGGGAMFLGTQLVTLTSDEPGHNLPVSPLREPPPGSTMTVQRQRERFHVAASPIALAGIAALAASFLFDGHTASLTPVWLMRFSSAIHVLAGATWTGGVAMLARILVARHRSGRPLDVARLVIPFSTVAGAAVTMVGLAGGVMALVIAKTPVAFFTTPWGRAMLAKLALVTIAGAIGAYNHHYVVPLLRADPDHPMAADSIRTTVRLETGLLLAVGAATAVLVGLGA